MCQVFICSWREKLSWEQGDRKLHTIRMGYAPLFQQLDFNMSVKVHYFVLDIGLYSQKKK